MLPAGTSESLGPRWNLNPTAHDPYRAYTMRMAAHVMGQCPGLFRCGAPKSTCLSVNHSVPSAEREILKYSRWGLGDESSLCATCDADIVIAPSAIPVMSRGVSDVVRRCGRVDCGVHTL